MHELVSIDGFDGVAVQTMAAALLVGLLLAVGRRAGDPSVQRVWLASRTCALLALVTVLAHVYVVPALLPEVDAASAGVARERLALGTYAALKGAAWALLLLGCLRLAGREPSPPLRFGVGAALVLLPALGPSLHPTMSAALFAQAVVAAPALAWACARVARLPRGARSFGTRLLAGVLGLLAATWTAYAVGFGAELGGVYLGLRGPLALLGLDNNYVDALLDFLLVVALVVTLVEVEHRRVRSMLEARLEELDESRALLASVLDGARDAVVGAGADGRVCLFNRAAEEIFARPATEVLGAPLERVVPDGFRAVGPLPGSSGEAPDEPRLRGLRPGGRTFPLEGSVTLATSGRRELRVALLRDARERLDAERGRLERLERARTQQAAVLRIARAPELARGDVEATARLVSSTLAAALGVERAAVWLFVDGGRRMECVDHFERGSGRHAAGDSLVTADCPVYVRALEEGRAIDARDALRDPRTVEFAGGYLAETGVTALLDTPVRVAGELVGAVCSEHVGGPRLWRDDEVRFSAEVADQVAQVLATARERRAAAERRELERRLRHAQKLEAVGQLAGGIAHDFNNLLCAIRGFAQLGAGPDASEAERREWSAEIDRAAGRAADLTRQLLAYGRRQVLQVRAVEPLELVRDVQRLLRRVLPADIELELRAEGAPPRVRADPGQIEQVLLNLGINARDALVDAPDDGRARRIVFSVGVALAPGGPDVRPAGRYVVFEVSDTGHGIAPEHLEHVFEPFFTTKVDGRGTGLGLATSYGIVEQHGGWIEVESVLGSGTSFRVHVPATVSEPQPQPEPRPENPPIAAPAAQAASLARVLATLLVARADGRLPGPRA